MAKKTTTASIAPTRPRTDPPSSRPSDGVKKERKQRTETASTKPLRKSPSSGPRGSVKKKRTSNGRYT